MVMRPFRPVVGRKQFRGSFRGGAQQALAQDLQASIGEVLGNLKGFISHMEGATPEIVAEALRPTYELSQELVPVESGELKASGYLEVRTFRGAAEVEIGYGRGGNPDYAIYVHEIPAWHEPPTQDKFLQAAIEANYFDILERVPALIREAAGT